jgi:hypothetical protein
MLTFLPIACKEPRHLECKKKLKVFRYTMHIHRYNSTPGSKHQHVLIARGLGFTTCHNKMLTFLANACKERYLQCKNIN